MNDQPRADPAQRPHDLLPRYTTSDPMAQSAAEELEGEPRESQPLLSEHAKASGDQGVGGPFYDDSGSKREDENEAFGTSKP